MTLSYRNSQHTITWAVRLWGVGHAWPLEPKRSFSVAVQGEDRKWLMGRCPGPQLGRAFFRHSSITDDTLCCLFKEALGLVFTGLIPPLRDLGHSSWDEALFTQMENWAGPGPVENSGKLRNQANRIEKKNHSSVMERVQTLNLSPAP